jgi:hypothetical protein
MWLTRRWLLPALACMLMLLAQPHRILASPTSSGGPAGEVDRALADAQLELAAAQAAEVDIATDDAYADTLAAAHSSDKVYPSQQAASAIPISEADAKQLKALEHSVNTEAVQVLTQAAAAEHSGLAGLQDGDPADDHLISRSLQLEDLTHPDGTLPPEISEPMHKIMSHTYEHDIHELLAAEARQNSQKEDADLDDELREIVQPECPLDGTFHQLRRFGHRLWYEGDITLARACFDKGIKLYLSPTNTIQPISISSATAPTDHARYKNVLLETHSMREHEFEDFGHVVDLIQQRTERQYSMPWSPVRAGLHDRMLSEGTLVHDQREQKLAQKKDYKKLVHERQLANQKKRQEKRAKKMKQQKQQKNQAGQQQGKKSTTNSTKERTQKRVQANPATASSAGSSKSTPKQRTSKKPAVSRESIRAAVDAKMAALKKQHGV